MTPVDHASHFARYRDFIEGGHFGLLTLVQAAVWHTMEQHADPDGYACPSNDTLARSVRHSQNRHVRDAKADLVRLGYLEKTGRKNGTYKTDIYRVTLPALGAPSPCPDSGHRQNDHHAPIPPSPCPDSAPHPAPIRGDKQPTKQPIQQPIKKREAAAPVPLPAVLDIPEFRRVWSEWEAYRKDRHLAPWKEKTLGIKLAELEGIGPAAAAECIRLSIGNGWQGLFPEKFTAKQQSKGAYRGKPADTGIVENLTL